MIEDRHPRAADGEMAFVRRVLIVVGILAVGVLIWRLLDVLVLAFGAILVAAVLHAISDPVARRTPLSQGWALTVAGLILLAVVGGTGWMFAAQVSSQISNALGAARDAIPTLGQELGIPGLSDYITRALQQAFSGGGALGQLTSFGTTALEAVTDILLVVIGGIYLAVNPGLYRAGIVLLFPVRAHARVGEALDTSGRALKLWLLGQFFSMVLIGTLSWLATWMIGLPSPAGLGLIAGVTEFIPLLGPFLGGIPAVLIALTQGFSVVLWTVLAFVFIQEAEAHLVQPLITRRVVSLPPALLLFAFAAFGTLFGILGVLFAAPLTVVAFVLVKQLYVRQTLGERTEVPGETKQEVR